MEQEKKNKMAENVVDAMKKASLKKISAKPLNGDPTLRQNPAVLDPMKEINYEREGELLPDDHPSVQFANEIKDNPMGKLNGVQKVRDDANVIMDNKEELLLKDNPEGRKKVIKFYKEEEKRKQEDEAKKAKEKKEEEEKQAKKR